LHSYLGGIARSLESPALEINGTENHVHLLVSQSKNLALAELHQSSGCKLVTLVHRLQASRGAVRQTLHSLIEWGYVMHNPGYGHPMRPEYILTPAGEPLAKSCSALMDRLRQLRLDHVGLRKWSLAVLMALGLQRSRFSEVRRRLPDISDRALSLTFKHMQSTGLIERHIVHRYPPTTCYGLTAKARRLRPLVSRLSGDNRRPHTTA